MFGKVYKIKERYKGEEREIKIAPPNKDEFCSVIEAVNTPDIYTFYENNIKATTYESREGLYNLISKSSTNIVWGVYIDGEYIGSTSLTELNLVNRTAKSHTILFNREYWNLKIGSTVCLIRCWVAANVLQLYTVASDVYKGNIASLKMLEKIGYTVVGYKPGVFNNNGDFTGQYSLLWINPQYEEIVLFNEKDHVKESLKEGITNAQKVLDEIEKLIT